MKRYILLAISLSLFASAIAQDRAIKEGSSSIKIPSYLHQYVERTFDPNLNVPKDILGTLKMSYYVDANNAKIMHGTQSITGEYTSENANKYGANYGNYRANVSITLNAVDNHLDGPFKATYSESQSDQRSAKITASITTIFRNNVIKGNTRVDYTLQVDNKVRDKYYWYIDINPSNGNITKVKAKFGNRAFDFTVDSKRRITGTAGSMKISNSLITNKVLHANGEASDCTDKEREIIAKYTSGAYSLDDVIKAGYQVVELNEKLQLSQDFTLMKSFRLGKRDFGQYGEIEFPLLILTRGGVATFSELKSSLASGMINPLFVDIDNYDAKSGTITIYDNYAENNWGTHKYSITQDEAEKFAKHCSIIVNGWIQNTVDAIFGDEKFAEKVTVQDKGFVINKPLDNLHESVNYLPHAYKIVSFERIDNSYTKYKVDVLTTNYIDDKQGYFDEVYSVMMSFHRVDTYGNDRYIDTKLMGQQRVASSWDTFREIKANVDEQHEKIKSYTSEVLLDQYMVLYTQNSKIKITCEESIAAMKRVQGVQKNIFALWDKYGKIKSQLGDNHYKICNTKSNVLNSYKSRYTSYTLKKESLEDHIVNGRAILALQNQTIELLEQYNELKAQAAKNHSEICKFSSSVLNKYKGLYSEYCNEKESLEEGIAASKEMLALQQKSLEMVETYKKMKREASTNHASICQTQSDVLTKYKGQYYTYCNEKESLEDGIEASERILATQKLTMEQLATYKELKREIVISHRNYFMLDTRVLNKYNNAYREFCNEKNSLEVGIDSANQMIELQNQTFKLLEEYQTLKQQVFKIHGVIDSAKSALIFTYRTLFLNYCAERESLEEVIELSHKILAIQKEVILFLALVDEAKVMNSKLMVDLKPAKMAYKAYKSFYGIYDFNWTNSGDDIEIVNKLISVQKELIKISERENLKQDEKFIRKQNPATLEAIIKAYEML